ncbi:MAG: exosortase H-associated membrane protein [Xanthomonadales bacterium]|nr:exosortase H-associated membrane protein [Xanthomonadales bacterium]
MSTGAEASRLEARQAERRAADPPVSLRQFFLLGLLWLPLMFFLWFSLRSPVVYPVTRAVSWLSEALLPGLVTDVAQDFHRVTYAFVVPIAGAPGLPGDRLLIEQQSTNVLMYCWGLPLLFGLIMATPLTWRRTFLQMAIGLLVLLPVQVFGVFGDILKTLAFGVRAAVETGLAESGHAALAPAAAAAAEAAVHGALRERFGSLELIALLYQFGYLILPAVVPAALWLLMNRRFLEQLVGWKELGHRTGGRSGDSPNPAAS